MVTSRSTDLGRSRWTNAVRWLGLLLLGWAVLLGVLIALGEWLTGPLAGSVGVRENQLAKWSVEHRSGTLTGVAEAASLLGEAVTVFVLGPIFLLVVWLWRREARPVFFLLAATLGEIAAYLVTVSVVSRPRPPVVLLDKGLDHMHSYPSGHVAAATALYGGMAILIWLLGGLRIRWTAWVFAAVPPVVALSRLYLGVHHVSDVMISIILMSAWLAFVAAVLLKPELRYASASPNRSSAHA